VWVGFDPARAAWLAFPSPPPSASPPSRGRTMETHHPPIHSPTHSPPSTKHTDFTKPSDRVGYLLNLSKNGMDPLDVLSATMNSRGWKARGDGGFCSKCVGGLGWIGVLGVKGAWRFGLGLCVLDHGSADDRRKTHPAPPTHTHSLTQASPKRTPTHTHQALAQHPEIQHRILEENPLLEAFDGFKELKEGGRRLSAQEVGG
jgi:hypothetical protein